MEIKIKGSIVKVNSPCDVDSRCKMARRGVVDSGRWPQSVAWMSLHRMD